MLTQLCAAGQQRTVRLLNLSYHTPRLSGAHIQLTALIVFPPSLNSSHCSCGLRSRSTYVQHVDGVDDYQIVEIRLLEGFLLVPELRCSCTRADNVLLVLRVFFV